MRFKRILSKLLDLFFPRHCAICDKIVSGPEGICISCKGNVRLLTQDVCMVCGKKLSKEEVHCFDCKRKKHEFIRNFSVFEYPVIRESLYRFKYRGRAEYAGYYAGAAYELHGKRLRLLQADAIVPVPLHRSRYRKRGYNQAEELAKELSLLLGIPVKTDLIKRVKSTKAMKKLGLSERQNNLKKAFLIMQNDVKLKTIILVDDIYTTGTTMDEISRACKAAGVENIYSLTVAVGNGL